MVARKTTSKTRPKLAGHKTGILVPLYTLRSAHAPGTGDYLSLMELGDFCAQVGIDLIQLLPLNDSGTDPSPYSALSAYALHPLFIRISELPEYKLLAHGLETPIETAISALEAQLATAEKQERLNYTEVLNTKFEIYRLLFTACSASIAQDARFKRWIRANGWVREYAVFRSIKQENDLRSWIEWGEHRNPRSEEIEKLWVHSRYKDSNLLFAWLQYRAEEQFLRSAEYLRSIGVMLKGDIPILMNDDSVALWAHRQLFTFELRAGAPPDMFSFRGQNWGFPIYDWEALKQEDFAWWRLRLRQAAKFYDAYRIDHVLGFFRIWANPHVHRDGVLGYFTPALHLERSELNGIRNERIFWLCEPHCRREELEAVFGEQTERVISACFTQHYDMYIFSADVAGEKYIYSLNFEPNIIEEILRIYRDRALIQIQKDVFAHTWVYKSCSRYASLSEGEKQAMEALIAQKSADSEALWEERGRELLRFMVQETPMLCCAEDLGVVPLAVPGVLEELGILGLKLPRWEHSTEPAQSAEALRFTPMSEYPYQSVTAFSVHDSSTVREWWESEEGSHALWQQMQEAEKQAQTDAQPLTSDSNPNPTPPEYSPELAFAVLKCLLQTNSHIAVFQMQDLLAIQSEYRSEQAAQERMNIPGTVAPSNWSYRMPTTIGELRQNPQFTQKVQELLSTRKKL